VVEGTRAVTRDWNLLVCLLDFALSCFGFDAQSIVKFGFCYHLCGGIRVLRLFGVEMVPLLLVS
jgi:hypothetical protein